MVYHNHVFFSFIPDVYFQLRLIGIFTCSALVVSAYIFVTLL